MQVGNVKEIDARLKSLHLCVSSTPLMVTRPIMDLCKEPDSFNDSAVEKVINALEEVDNFNSTCFETCVDERFEMAKSSSGARREYSEEKHWTDVKNKFEDATFNT